MADYSSHLVYISRFCIAALNPIPPLTHIYPHPSIYTLISIPTHPAIHTLTRTQISTCTRTHTYANTCTQSYAHRKR